LNCERKLQEVQRAELAASCNVHEARSVASGFEEKKGYHLSGCFAEEEIVVFMPARPGGYGQFCLFIALHCKVRRHAQKDPAR
jgi:hypothetical protein